MHAWPKAAVILAVETSCDETAAAVVRAGRETLGAVISTQIDLHALYGGVVPEIASRRHVETLDGVVDGALEAAGMRLSDVDALAVTAGPGLVGALLCGVSWAKAAAYALGKPLIAVHHIAGHIAANYLDTDIRPPFVCLVVSGGHTHLVRVAPGGVFTVLGHTRDDAAGEALDKAARALGLPYPGGPNLEKLARDGDPHAYALPRARLPGCEFSFSGLKTALLQLMQKNPDASRADLAASFQHAVVGALADKAIEAAVASGDGKLLLCGGVAANTVLRETLAQRAAQAGLFFAVPALHRCTDNAEMIAAEAYFAAMGGCFAPQDLNAMPSWKLEDARAFACGMCG